MPKTKYLKRKAFFEEEQPNKHVKNDPICEEYEGDSVIVELDVNFRSTLLKHKFKPRIAKYVKFYQNEDYRNIIIKKPQTSIKLFGESMVMFVISLLTKLEFNTFLENCAMIVTKQHLNYFSSMRIYELLKQLECDRKSFHPSFIRVIEHAIFEYFHLINKSLFSAGVYQYLPTAHSNYPNMVNTLVGVIPSTIKILPSHVHHHVKKETILRCIGKFDGESLLPYFPSKFKSDREIILEAVKCDGTCLEYVVDEFKSDEEIVKAAITQNVLSFNFASDELKNQKSIKLLSIQSYYPAPDDWFRNEMDREIILEAAKRIPSSFSAFPDQFKSDREIVIEVVKRKGDVLCHVSKELQSDIEIVKLAIASKVFVLEDLPEEFKTNKTIILEAVQNTNCYERLSKELQLDKEVIFAALNSGNLDYQNIPKEALKTKEILLELIILLSTHEVEQYLKDHELKEDWILD